VFTLSGFQRHLSTWMMSGWKQSSSVNPDLRLNRIKSSVKSNPD